jgi:hypothetical protein
MHHNPDSPFFQGREGLDKLLITVVAIQPDKTALMRTLQAQFNYEKGFGRKNFQQIQGLPRQTVRPCAHDQTTNTFPGQTLIEQILQLLSASIGVAMGLQIRQKFPLFPIF